MITQEELDSLSIWYDNIFNIKKLNIWVEYKLKKKLFVIEKSLFFDFETFSYIFSPPDCHLYFRNQQGLTAHTHQKHPKDPDVKSEIRCQFCSKTFTCKDLYHQVEKLSVICNCSLLCFKIFKWTDLFLYIS